MASIASIIAQGPRPTNFGILTPNEQDSQRNALAQQVAQTGLTQQQTALERQRVAREKQEAEARARELRDQQLWTQGIAKYYGQPSESATPSQGATTPPPVNNLEALSAIPTQRDEANLTPDQSTDREPVNALAAPPPIAPRMASTSPSAPTAAPKVGLPAPKGMTPREANDALERFYIANGGSAPGLVAWRTQRQAMEQAAEKLTKEQRENMLAQHAVEQAALEAVDAETDPVRRRQQALKAAQIVPGFDPSDVSHETVQSHINGLRLVGGIARGKEAEAKLDLTKAQAAEGNARAKALEANATQTARASMAGPLAAAADSGDPDAYAAAYHRLPANEQSSGEWPTPEEYDPETSGDRIRAAASPVKEQIRSAQFEERESRLKEHSSDMKDRWKGMEDAAKERNRIAAAKAGSPTGNAAGIANRFDRRMAADLDKQEARLHSQLFDLGTIIGTKSVTNPTTGQAQAVTDLTYYQGKMAAAQDRLQTIQFNKATLLGLGIPDKKAVVAIPEGSQIAAPDGSIWQKRDGVAYWESGKGKPSAPAALANPTPAAQAQPPAGGLQPGAQNPFGMAAPVGAKPSSTPPPANVAAGTPEGHTATGPDGVIWKKVKGRMVRQ